MLSDGLYPISVFQKNTTNFMTSRPFESYFSRYASHELARVT
jgi:hypothetical protein